MDKDLLIDNSSNIFLAKLVKTKMINTYTTIKSYEYSLIPVKELKGHFEDTVQFYSHRTGYDSTSFDNHKDTLFWKQNIGRSDWPCCICGPDFSFVENEVYLLFPNHFGAFKSAEIIRDSVNDEWYKYVLGRINK